MPVAQEFRRCKCQVDTAMDMEAGIEAIEKGSGQPKDYATVLADIVLPRRKVEPGIGRYLGLSVASVAARSGRVRRVGFLTVVSWKELKLRFDELKNAHKNVEFRYFNKADLLSPGSMQELSDFVRINCGERKK